MNYVDQKYINLISVYLERFKTLNSGLYTFRCPICGDSQKNKYKTRGYLYTFDDVVAFRCHNCQASMSLANFIKHFSVGLWQEYCYERFYNGEKRTPKQREAELTSTKPVFNHDKNDTDSEGSREGLERKAGILARFPTIASLPAEHPAKTYVQGRRIPEVLYHELHYTADLREVFRAIPRYSERVPRAVETAVLIPFYDGGLPVFVQARILESPDPHRRHQTFQLDELGKKVWGLNHVDWSKRVWVFEGPIDAMMIDNGIAVAGGALTSEIKYLQEKCDDFVFVFDNDYRSNYEIFYQFKKAVDLGIPVVIYDRKFPFKDANEAIKNGWSRDQLHAYLSQRTKQGLSAQLALSEFKHPIKK